MTTRLFIPCLLFLMLVSCHDVNISTGGDTLKGPWLLYEIASPQATGNNIVSVPAEPAQIITFRDNSMMTTTIDTWQEFKYYRLTTDTDGRERLQLLQSDPDLEPRGASTPNSYWMILKDGELTLRDVDCAACHLAFKRTEGN